MDLSLTPLQIEFRDAARQLVQAEAPDSVLVPLQDQPTGYVPSLWAKLAGSGWLGMLVAEEHGGAGVTATDAAVAFEEFGRGPLPFLLYASSVLSALLVEALGSDVQRRAWLPALASGEVRFSPALAETSHGWEASDVHVSLSRRGDDYVLSGRKLFVPDAAGATHFLVTAQRDEAAGVAVAIVDAHTAGVSWRPLQGMLDWQAEVSFSDVPVAADQVLMGGDRGSAWDSLQAALRRAIPVLTAFQVGSCQSVFEMSLEYSRTRVQFGRPIGQFQRLQDHIIRLVNHLDMARWTTYEALWCIDSGRPARAAVHVAKAVAAEAHWEACNAAHEVHAAIGSDLRFGLAKHTMMSRSLYAFLGDPRWHRAKLAEALGW